MRKACLLAALANPLLRERSIDRRTTDPQRRVGTVSAFIVADMYSDKMDEYRVMQVGSDFIVFAGNVGVLKCRTEKDAQAAIAVAMDLLEDPDEWWSVLRQRLAASESRGSRAA